MYGIIFYKDQDGVAPVYEYIKELERRSGKDARINLRKVLEYVRVLKAYGTLAGEPYIKHLDGEIWELRPIRERVLFAAWTGEIFVLLHHFMKKTRATPQREIEQAKRELKGFRERMKENEQYERYEEPGESNGSSDSNGHEE
ncbi:MAG: type II toxin-antitoxin system RelE/ParE family toxin [Synergistaceae bacterium]|nr:type II toxin-antitoxin system RelE/ParE family toxin [Synergistaceae bacterium]